MNIAYFVNQYPKVSHSFIRREILALETLGISIQRFALRGWNDHIVDPDDLIEQKQTSYVLESGLSKLFFSATRLLIKSPGRFLGAFILTLKVSRYSDRHLFKHLITLAEASWLCEQLRNYSVDHLHAHFGTNSAEVAMLCHVLGGPKYSFTVHGPEEFDKPQALHLREKIERSDFVVAISSFGRSQLMRWVDQKYWVKIKEVHCGIDQTFFHAITKPIPTTPRLVCVGRLCEQKGQLLLIEAAKILRDKGIPFTLILAGDGEMRSKVEGLIQSYNLVDRVQITGWISAQQVREELLAARAMVLPSFAEGLPVVIMEALALRRPVLTTYVAGIPELVQHRRNGWLFPAGSIEALSDVIEECLSAEDSTLISMGDAGYQDVKLRHDVYSESKKLFDYFCESSA